MESFALFVDEQVFWLVISASVPQLQQNASQIALEGIL
jgi:hypothetical protein